MIRHKAIAVKAELVPFYAVLQEREKALTVFRIEEYVLLSIPAENYMIHRAGIM